MKTPRRNATVDFHCANCGAEFPHRLPAASNRWNADQFAAWFGAEGWTAQAVCGACQAAPVVAVVADAPISETRPAPRPITPLTADETITALAASVERVAPPPSVTAADLSRHAVRMRKAGLPVDELDPHERARLSLSRSHRIGCAS